MTKKRQLQRIRPELMCSYLDLLGQRPQCDDFRPQAHA